MNNKILFGIGGIVLGVIVTLLLSSGVQGRSMMWGGNYSNSLNNSNNRASGRIGGMMNNIDKHFIEQMIPHHDGAIAMAKLALQKAKRPEIKTLSQAIIKAQEEENESMRSWYKNWFGKGVDEQDSFSMMQGSGMMSGRGMHMGGQEDMKILENAGDFDKAFIEGMIPHHQLAIMMAQMLKSGTDRPEMLVLANNIIESQSDEIQKMQGWYNAWYK